ncbi:MAG: type II CRISPR RNA-guided endonuclease Cas9 [Ignavibacteriaceae bacterium]|nr:type II CRISPR RNA-guided endonuclease Cas9 [Ignavibacteriaceae bacterium]
MKKILGLDLGVSSIGWALVDSEEKKILGMGTRIVPLTTDDTKEFSSGNAISKNQARTQKRTQRKGYDRYQLRRKYLIEKLKANGMLPGEELTGLNKLDLWKLRSNGVSEKLSLQEIGRVLLHLNQKRGYKSSRSDANLDKKDTEYVAEVKSRHQQLKEEGITIGQKFFNELSKDSHYRIKKQVFPREAYIEEFDAIIAKQREFYPDLLTEELIDEIRNSIIYYQRRLKSQKRLVSVCEFEGFTGSIVSGKREKEILMGPKVAPKSSPLFQICRIWEAVNNIEIELRSGGGFTITPEHKKQIAEYLDNNEKMSITELLKILKLKKEDVYKNKLFENGLPGNKTKTALLKCFDGIQGFEELFRFEFNLQSTGEEGYLIDKGTGEIKNSKPLLIVNAEVENQPFYQLWHTVYSIQDKDDCKKALSKKFGIPDEVAEKLAAVDFTHWGFGNKSHRAIRKILPYLLEGDGYYAACSYAGYNHSRSLTKEENAERLLKEKLRLLDKNELRQPVVEKILNQMINVVNAIIDRFGKPDEIRIELARELKQSREERNKSFKYLSQRTKENQEIEERLKEYGLRPTRNNIIKWRLYHEINNEDKKINAICVYCGQPIPLTAAIKGEEVDIEHIIPRSLLYDDSQGNKTLAHRKCNADKGDMTAYDFMAGKGTEALRQYRERVFMLSNNGLIGKGKRDKLLMPASKIPKDFIDRQLRETQYISKKAREILLGICRNVWATTGEVTSELRHLWGWDDVLMNLQLPRYRSFGLTEIVEINENGNIRKKEIIKGWSKRDDHRHHAIDALVIACTKQSYIHRMNTLSSSETRSAMMKDIANFDRRRNLLENYIIAERPFTTAQVMESAALILISMKPGKKVATTGRRIVRKGGRVLVKQTGIIVPRGALSEETVYGKIKRLERREARQLFENPGIIFKSYIRKLVEHRLEEYQGDAKKAAASLKKNSIYLDQEKKIKLEYASCFAEAVVVKKDLKDIKANQIENIIDPKIRELVHNRLAEHGGNLKEAFGNLEEKPLWLNKEKGIAVKRVRMDMRLSAIEPLKNDDYSAGFVKPGNNHHLAVYITEAGEKTVAACTFWHAVERKKFGLPVIIKDPAHVFDMIFANDPGSYPDSFLEKLPHPKWKFVESYQQNEMFILEVDDTSVPEPIPENRKELSSSLYRVQKLALIGKQINLYFRHHLETSVDDSSEAKDSKRFLGIQSIGALDKLRPRKIRIDLLGSPEKI